MTRICGKAVCIAALVDTVNQTEKMSGILRNPPLLQSLIPVSYTHLTLPTN